MTKLHEFLQFGMLNRVGFGSTAQHIRRVVGAYPEIAYENKSHRPCIYKYGGLQFLFYYNEDNQRSEVECMVFEFDFEPVICPRILRPDDWFPNRQTTDKQFHRYITKYGLNWKVLYDFGDEIHYVVAKSHICFEKKHKGFMLSVLEANMRGYPEPVEKNKYKPRRNLVAVPHKKKDNNQG